MVSHGHCFYGPKPSLLTFSKKKTLFFFLMELFYLNKALFGKVSISAAEVFLFTSLRWHFLSFFVSAPMHMPFLWWCFHMLITNCLARKFNLRSIDFQKIIRWARTGCQRMFHESCIGFSYFLLIALF